MTINLNSIGMEKDQQYETIIITENEKNEKNVAPIGVFCGGSDEIKCRIFKGTTTLNNIIKKGEFIVNITSNPLFFTLSLIDNLPEEYFNCEDDPFLKDTDAYFKCKVVDLKYGIKLNDPIRKAEIGIIKAKVNKIVINNPCGKALNRGIYCLLESLVNYTRIDIVDKEQQNYFIDRLKESERIINKVGSEGDKKSIKLLKQKFEDKGYEIE
jgi:hypothetical protein